MRRKLDSAEKHLREGKVAGSYPIASDFVRAHVHNQMIVIAHHGIRVNATGKDVGEFQYSPFNPWFAVLKAFARIVVEAT